MSFTLKTHGIDMVIYIYIYITSQLSCSSLGFSNVLVFIIVLYFSNPYIFEVLNVVSIVGTFTLYDFIS